MKASEAVQAWRCARRYLRPLKLEIAFSMLAELGLFIVFGVIRSPELRRSPELSHWFLPELSHPKKEIR